MLESTCSAQEHVLAEMKVTKTRIADLRMNRDNLDEAIAETAKECASLEHKTEMIKQRQAKESAISEADLKSDLERKKVELDQLQEQIAKIRREQTKKPKATDEAAIRFDKGLIEIKTMMRDLVTSAVASKEPGATPVAEIARIVPKEQEKLTAKIESLQIEKQQLEAFE